MTPETAQTILTENFAPWVMALHPTVTEIGPDRTILTIPITPDLNRTGGIVSGQAMTALADTAEVTRAGKSMMLTRCTIIAEPSGKPVALATATFAR